MSISQILVLFIKTKCNLFVFIFVFCVRNDYCRFRPFEPVIGDLSRVHLIPI